MEHGGVGRDATTDATKEQWGVEPSALLSRVETASPDTCWSSRGGFVTSDLGSLDEAWTGLSDQQFGSLNEGVRWSMLAAVQALAAAGMEPSKALREDVGVVLGNLSYAPRQTSNLFAQHWIERQEQWQSIGIPFETVDSANRFSSSAPARWIAKTIGATGPVFVLMLHVHRPFTRLNLLVDICNHAVPI